MNQPGSVWQTAASRHSYWLAALIGLGCLPAILARGTAAQVAGLAELAGSSPYFHPEHAWLLYLWMPLVAASSFLFYLSPGAFLILSFGKAKGLLEQILLAFGASLALSIFLETGLKLIFGTPLSPDALVGWWIGASLAAALLFLLRAARGAPLFSAGGPDLRRSVWMIAAALAGLAVLTPKIFWENFNVDGTEAFEFGRSLTSHVLPHWDIQGGAFGFYHNFVLFAYPNHWFIALFGPLEASVRLPFVLNIVLLFCALILLIEQGSRRRLRWPEEAALWLGLVLFSIVQVYNTTYDPFFCDIAEPGAADCLMLVCFLSACYFLWTDRLRYSIPFAAMTYLATVGGSALLIALGATVLLWQTPRRWGYLKAFGILACACGVAALVHETFYNHLVLGGAKDQFSTRNMAARLFPPTLTEFPRLAAILFPSGLLPALSIAAVRKKDWIAWSAGVISILYAGVIYLQSWTALHQFTPAMVLPLIVFWRVYLNAASHRGQRWLLTAIILAAVSLTVLSLPRTFQINRAASEFGKATVFQVGDYGPGYETAVHAGASVLKFLLPGDYRLQYPNQPWGMDDESWIYYSFRPKPPGTEVNYIVQAASAPAPENTTLAGSANGFSAYIRDSGVWARDRNQKFPQIIQSPLYEPILRRTCQFFRDYIARQQANQKLTTN